MDTPKETPTTGAATSANGAGPTTTPGDPLADSRELNRARMAADLQTVRRQLDRIGPGVYVIAYFAALACLILAVIARRLAK